ncbi:MAG: type II toxin-antitoxin system RelE/ParE family toxin [Acidobacteriota bacterium]|nr:MAG: type II toxin-antitoxin system RelE/ParE family toxin [Acidobacteriota bacterium]
MAKLLTFVETEVFRKSLDRHTDLSTLFAIQADLIEDPERGDLVPGTGGLRKARAADRRSRKGKRGGFRFIYLYLKEPGIVYLLYLYPKSAKADLTSEDKHALARLAAAIKDCYRS